VVLATLPTNLLLKRCGFSTSKGPECSTRRRIRGRGGVVVDGVEEEEVGDWDWESRHCWFASSINSSTYILVSINLD